MGVLPYHATDIILEDSFSLQADFGLSIWNQQPSNETFVFSPLTLALGLAMIHSGAKSTTKDQFGEPLRFVRNSFDPANYTDSLHELYTSLNSTDGAKIQMANYLFVRQGISVNPDFVEEVKKNFSGNVKFIDFGDGKARETINSFIDHSTLGNIPKIIDSIAPDSSMLLATALRFDAKWKNPFYRTATVTSAFHLADGSIVYLPLMHSTDEYLYGETDQWKVLGLPYANHDFILSIILSKYETDIKSLRKPFPIQGTDLRDLLKNLEFQEVSVTVPRFKIDFYLEPKPGLESIGLTSIFSKEADFEGIANRLSVSQISHRAVFSVDEDGTRLSPKPSLKLFSELIGDEPAVFRADKPFFFVLTHRDSLLYMGQFYG